jgi:uncharacterized repeat protein (TIGR01451 family)
VDTTTGQRYFMAPDHEYPSHLELRLTATDSGGLTDTESVLLDPQTVVLALRSTPAGLQLAVNGTANTTPFDRTVINGSKNTLTAPSPQDMANVRYAWQAWSDGGAQTHEIVADAAATYHASFVPISADVAIVKTAASTANGFTFIFQVTNNGPATAQNIAVTDTLSDKLAFVSGQGCSAAGQVVNCTIGSLNTGQTAIPQIAVRVVKRGGFLDNTATVSASTPDLITSNNSSTIRVRVR